MDYKRLGLIAGLVIVSYMLLLEWNRDYGDRPFQGTQQTVSTENGQSALLDDLPDAGSAPSEDIPSPSGSNAQIALGEEAAASSQQSEGRLIQINTPVQEVTIDLLGGDIVNLRLPRFPATLETPDDPFVLMSDDNNLVYVAQSGLIGADGIDSNQRARYSTAQQRYTLSENSDPLNVDLLYTTDSGVEITKRFTFWPDDYLINISYIINNNSDSVWTGNLFGQVKRDGSGDPSSSTGLGMSNYLGAVLTTANDPYKRVDFGDIDSRPTRDEVQGGWIGFSQHYFLGAWIPDGTRSHTYTTRKNSAGQYLMGFVSPATTVQPGTTSSINSAFWAGPKDQYRLGEIREYLELTIDYGWLWFVAQPIFWLLTQVNRIVGNYGWSIIGMTLVIKVMFMWLSAKSYRSMAKMRKLAPKIQQLKERHGEDKQKMMQAQMEMWRKEKVNPMGGCLPMLLQMPVLIGVYWVLMESVELRQAEWILWYDDLSAMDPYFILPIIMGASMLVSQLMTPMTTMDPMQQKVMRYMPVFFTIFFLWFPAGLVLYWLVSNLFNIAQQWYINRKVDATFHPKGI